MLALNITVLTMMVAAAMLHFAWAEKLWWPISDEKQLVRAVAGFPNANRMPPPFACLFVATALTVVAIMFLTMLIRPSPNRAIGMILFGAAFIFLGRGSIGFTPFWPRVTPEQPFRWLDLRIYSPLCLIIGSTVLLASIS